MTHVTDKKTKRIRRLRPDTKYEPRFAEELLSGVRYKNKLSIPEICRKWRISRKTFWLWRQNYQEFSDAADLAELDYAAYWMELYRDVAEGTKKGNAQLIALAVANVEQLGWSPKVDITSTKEEKISTININIRNSAPLPIEHQEGCVIEHELPDNVKKLPVLNKNEQRD